MILGIDASNIRAGGGVVHLVELLRAVEPRAHGFDRVIVWGGAATLAQIEQRDWLCKVHVSILDRRLHYRIWWQWSRLRHLARRARCAVLFVPGGSDFSGFRPMVAMNQNLLPFERREMRRYGWSLARLKFLLLRFTQRATFRRADGLIYLSEYARGAVERVVGAGGQSVVVPHGINRRFFASPRPPRSAPLGGEPPLRVLYVSVVETYKHQWHVVEAIAKLRREGYSVVLDLVGPPGPAIARLKATMARIDPTGAFVRYHGAVPYGELDRFYVAADIAVFASSCETFGQILTEAMSAGLPIACANRSAMPEILRDAGVYFDPEQPDQIAEAIRELIDSPERRAKIAHEAYRKSQGYSWQRCATDTFAFLGRIARASVDATHPGS